MGKASLEKIHNLVNFEDPLEFWFNIMTKDKTREQLEKIISRLDLTKNIRIQLLSKCDLTNLLKDLKSEKLYKNPPISTIQKIPNKILEFEYITTDNSEYKKILSQIIENIRKIDPILNGDDLTSFGVSHGKDVGIFLENIKKQRFLGLISTKEEEIGFVKSSLEN